MMSWLYALIAGIVGFFIGTTMDFIQRFDDDFDWDENE